MDAATVITELARELGVGDEAIKKWRQRPTGVPHRWRLPILDKATERGITLPREALEDFHRSGPERDRAA